MFPENALIVVQGGVAAGKSTVAYWMNKGMGRGFVYHIGDIGDITETILDQITHKTATVTLVLQVPFTELDLDVTPDMIVTVERGKK